MKYLLLASCILPFFQASGQRFIERSGQATFYSEAPVENISAVNDQVLAVLDPTNGEVAVSMLMKGFQFRKALMQEHFNESYLESDKFPKATFTGSISDYSPGMLENSGNVTVTGQLTIHGVTRPLTVEVILATAADGLKVESGFSVRVEDFDIDIPSVVIDNIAEVVDVTIKLYLKKSD